MQITANSTVADIATQDPGAIRVFQHHQIDFCCGGRIPLAQACEQRGLDPEAVLAELRAARTSSEERLDWREMPLRELVGYIQRRYHAPLRLEIPRLTQMLARVVARHGEAHPETKGLQATFDRLQRELLAHMAKEDSGLFPALVAIDAEQTPVNPGTCDWIHMPIEVMEAEHEAAGQALAHMRELTDGYTPPEGACPTFRGLYHGLAELERDMHVHVHLENNVLFPRARASQRQASSRVG